MIADLKPYPAYKDSGVEWLGEVPEHWKQLPGRACYRERQVPNTGLIETTVLSLSYGRIVVKPVDKLHGLVPASFETYQIVEPGDIIIRPTDLQNDWNSLRFGLSHNRGIITSAYLCFHTTDLLTREYGHLLLHIYDLSKVFYGLGSGLRQNLDWTDFKYLPCLVPPLPEQAAIVRFLDYSDRRIRRYIRAKQKLIALLEDQKQALIHQAVTGQIDVRTGRPYPAYKTSGVEWLGKVPEHWEIRRIASFSPNITNGWVGPTRDILTESGVPYIQSLHIKQGQIQFIKKYFVSNDWLSGHDKAQLRHSDVIVVQTGDIGQVACVPPNFDGAGCHALIIIRTDPDVMSGRFLDLVLRSNYGYNSLLRMQTGALHPHLNCTWVREIFVPVPPLAEQVAIVRYLDKVTDETYFAIHCARRQIDLFREYRTRLIADVVTGKLDVREAAAGLPEVDPVAAEFDAPTQSTETGVVELNDTTEFPEELAMENEATI